MNKNENTIAIIGRSELMYDTMIQVFNKGYKISLVVTAKEAPEYKYKSLDFEKFAKKINADFICKPKIDADSLKKLESVKNGINIALSVNYTGVISDEVISLFNNGILNAHSGDLPRYRGNACQAWAILNNEEKIGLCIHKMIGGELDSGDIISRDYYPLSIDTRIGETFEWMQRRIPILMIEAMEKLFVNPNYLLESQSKDPQKSMRCYPRKPEDGKINWSKSSKEILRLINASSEPFSGAFCDYEGEKIIIWRASLVHNSENYLAVPGQVAEILASGEIKVITGDGKLLVKEIEYKGERSIPSKFIKSIRKRLS